MGWVVASLRTFFHLGYYASGGAYIVRGAEEGI
jgi:hypothetical protein